MKRFIFISILITIMGLCGIAFGEVIFTMPCDGGGDITVDSTGFSYNPESGQFSIHFQINNCIDEDGTQFSGTVDSSGLFVLTSDTTANVNINVNQNVTVTFNGTTHNSICSVGLTGSYDLTTETLSGGDVSMNCSANGNFNLDLLDLLIGPMMDI